jgi:hypothetical protein
MTSQFLLWLLQQLPVLTQLLCATANQTIVSYEFRAYLYPPLSNFF